MILLSGASFSKQTNIAIKTILYDQMLLDFFTFLGELPKQSVWYALGSNQQVKAAHFQAKAKKAARLCQEAIDAEDTDSMPKKWRKVLGRFVPLDNEKQISSSEEYIDTEEFIEDLYPIDLEYDVELRCVVTQRGFRTWILQDLLNQNLPLLPQKKLEFSIIDCTVPEPYNVYWKVLNRGEEAYIRNDVRGQIIKGTTSVSRIEHTHFSGNHYVECYIVKNGIVVARAHQEVPIRKYNNVQG